MSLGRSDEGMLRSATRPRPSQEETGMRAMESITRRLRIHIQRDGAVPAKLSHFRTQSTEELVLISHALGCKVLRAKTPRAD
jgi:hypothetical protein